MQIFNKSNEKILTDYMPSPLCIILKQLKKLQEADPSVNFSYLFSVLTDSQKELVSRLLLEQEEEISQDEFHQLFQQFQKQQWKSIVKTIKMQLAQAKQEGDEAQVNQIMHDFLMLKNQIIQQDDQVGQTKRKVN